MRFIVTCMVVVGLCLFAIPLIPAFNSVQKEREAILANAATGINLDVPPPIADAFPATEMALDADAFAGIEPAAGDDFMEAPDSFTGGFTGQAPAAFGAEPEPFTQETE